MKKKLILLFCLLNGLAFQAQTQSKIFENKTMKSDLLGKEVKYTVYLPESYDTSDRTYPVLYLLHGYSDDHTSWNQFGQVKSIADESIKNGAAEMIIVMPDGGVSWYMNNADNSVRYEDMFFDEFIPFIEKSYKVRAKKESRAIAGLSMGGFGTLLYTLHRPDMFTAAFPMSAAIFSAEEMEKMTEEQYENRYAQLFGKSKSGKTRLTDHWKKNSIFDLIANMPAKEKTQIKLYVDCGDDDYLFKGNALLWIALRQSGIPSEFKVRDGGHSWTFWRDGLRSILPTVSKHFHRM